MKIQQYGTKAKIFIYGNIVDKVDKHNTEDVSATSFRKELDKLKNVSEIELYMNSGGGSVFSGISIYHMIERHHARFTGYVDGLGASISSVILMACDKVIMPSNAYLMIHNPWTFTQGNQHELRKQADDLERMREVSINAYLKKSNGKLTRDRVIEIMDNETWLLGSEAYEIGLCDEVAEQQKAVAYTNTNVLQKFKTIPDDLVRETAKTPEELAEEAIKLEETRQEIFKKYGKKSEEENMIELTNEKKLNKAQELERGYLLGGIIGGAYEPAIAERKALLEANKTNDRINTELSQSIGNSIAMGKLDIEQALYATTGTKEFSGDSFISHANNIDVVAERFKANPLLEFITLTNTLNLDEASKLITAVDDDELIEDDETAKELEATGKVVNFKRFKSKLFADVSETVELATNTNVMDKIKVALVNGLSAKEIKLMFGDTLKEEHEHMNFYHNDIKEVSGADMYEAIMNSLKDLSQGNRRNSIIVMNEDDFDTMRYDLASQGLCNLGTLPGALFHRPVIFIDEATKPIIGDFKYYQLNYSQVLADSDKDIKTGIKTVVLTTYFDSHVMLNNAFRIAVVAE
ncbi:MAG: head maturation protease, ClpP-related [Enterococcus sp.]